MRLEAYLCVSPFGQIYPSERFDDFEASDHVLARCDDATPLLWTAMFRLEDLHTDEVPTSTGAPVRATTVLASRRRALAQLYAVVPDLSRRLGGSVSRYADLLREAMKWLPGEFVTIEWWAGDLPGHPDIRQMLAELTDASVDPGHSAGMFESSGSGLHPSGGGNGNALRLLLGASHQRPVPWETPF